MSLAKLRKEYCDCQKCPLLAANRNQVVFGVGNPKTCKVVIIGEAPGAKEDLTGEPFVGRSGKLLDEFLDSIGLSRPKDVYITNTVLCKPPKNRDPTKIELVNCRDRLNRHIALLKPQVVITLGNFATKYMLETKEGINKLRGKTYVVNFSKFEVTVVPMQHPAVLLYNGNSPKKRAEFIADFAIVEKVLKKYIY